MAYPISTVATLEDDEGRIDAKTDSSATFQSFVASPSSTPKPSVHEVETTEPCAEPTPPKQSQPVGVLQSLSLPPFLRVSYWRTSKERRKIVFHKNFKTLILHIVLHTIPLSAAAVLIALNSSQYYISPTFPQAPPLQFAAKFHERLVQISVGEILFAIVRQQLVETFLPLGMAVAPLQQTQISYLWSLEFWSAVTSSQAHGSWIQRLLLKIVVPYLVIMTAVVGPSTAVAMVPRPGTTFINGYTAIQIATSFEELFPRRIDRSHNMTLDDRSVMVEKFLPDYQACFDVVPKKSFRKVWTSAISAVGQIWNTIDPAVQDPMNQNEFQKFLRSTTIATLPTESMVFAYQNTINVNPRQSNETKYDPSFSSYALQPVVTSRCFLSPNLTQENTNNGKLSQASDVPVLYWSEDGTGLRTMKNKSEMFQESIAAGAPSGDYAFADFTPLWYNLPGADAHSIVGFFFEYWSQDQLVILPTTPPYSPNGVLITACTVSAYWSWSRHHWAWEDGISTVSTDLSLEDFNKQSKVPIKLSVETIRVLRDPEVHRGMCSRATYVPTAVAIALSALKVLPPLPDGLFYSDRVASKPLIADRFVTYSSDSDRISENGSLTTLNGSWTAFSVEVSSVGYGYGSISAAVILSLVVLGLYCFTTLVYLSTLIFTRTVSTAWSSPAEFALLALRSRSAEFLGHTSVGVASISTFRQPVGIRVNDSDGLELVFANDRDVNHTTLGKVEPRKAY